MCTITIVPRGDALRLMCNRDERRDRPAAHPPAHARFGARVGIAPIDPVGGGSWIGINDAGLTVALLNRCARRGRESRRLESRGCIVTRLLECETLDAVAAAAAALDVRDYEPFRAIAILGRRALVADARAGRVAVRRFDVSRPRLLTSSSVEPVRALMTRGAAFRAMVLRAGDRALAQAEFHEYEDPRRRHIGVLMTRLDARTVSRTTVDICPRGLALTYESLDTDRRVVRGHIRF
jgi:Transport and Golgi organisation 2